VSGVDRRSPGTLALVGPGRVGRALAAGLARVGWRVGSVAGRSLDAPSVRRAAAAFGAEPRPVGTVADGASLVVLACPDTALDAVVTSLHPDRSALVVHTSGVRGLEALARVPARTGTLHPLMTIPDPDPDRLAGAWCGVSGDPQCRELARALGMHPVTVPDARRARYHAAATIASNHLVGLLAEVARVAPIPLEAYLPLVRATVENVAALGPAGALTGPVARGDLVTVATHLEALDGPDRPAYRALAAACARLAGRDGPEWRELLAPGVA